MKFPLHSLFVISLIFISSYAEDSCTLLIKSSNHVPTVNSDKVILVHYPEGQQPVKHILTNAHSTIPCSQFFDKASPMIIIIHGYAVLGKTDFQPLIDGLKSKNQVNIFELDYYEYATSICYPQVVVDVLKLGEILGNTLSMLKDNGVIDFHLIGHSLGAHLSGIAGKTYKKLKSTLLKRVTGLDPAGPCFVNEASDRRLASSDASFVDVMHTDVQLGMLKPIGQCDFFPNGGDNMPGIFNMDHFMSVAYFTESVTNNDFSSVACADWSTFKTGACKTNPVVPMGYWTPSSTTGNRYLRTEAKSLYALGTAGLS